MAEGFEPYHVPQQSRRDKLRIVSQSPPGCVDNLPGCAGLLPLYDPSLLPSDLLTCATPLHHHQTSSGPIKNEGGVNSMMGNYVGGMINHPSQSSSSSTSHHQHHHHHPPLYMDPQSSSILLNPSSIQDINTTTNPFFYTTLDQNLRILDHQSLINGTGQSQTNSNGQGLSLSLSSHDHQTNLPLELNLQRYESSSICADKMNRTVASSGGYGSRSPVPLGPFTGYASILKGSRFLKPAQQLLEELCDVGRGSYGEKVAGDDSSLMDSPMESTTLNESAIVHDSSSIGSGSGRKKSRLISMLDEVYKRYKYYYQQMQAVVASFESVAGLSNAAPYANLALKAMSKHFKCLKNAIIDQLQFTSKVHGNLNYGKDEIPRFGNADRSLHGQGPINSSGVHEHQPVWRPQRGLPERAVTVLRAWLFEHFLHPYPTDTDKLMLAKQTGLSRSQVSNWFINARVRLWKPMVEEIHTLETREAQKTSQGQREDQTSGDAPSDHLPTTNSLASENPSLSCQRTPEFSSKRSRSDMADISMAGEGAMSLSYDNLSRLNHAGNNGVGNAGGSRGVSLTLGLHHNNGMVLADPFPVNPDQRFGLDVNSNGYVIGNFEGPNSQFGREIMGGQLFHDFVG